MSLWLVRHARPLVEPGICYGALDLAADCDHTQASAMALAAVLPAHSTVQVSPLLRCRQLAQALAGLRVDLYFSEDARLREMDFGCWEGVPWDQIPRAALDAWTADFGSHRFGGRESANEVLARVGDAWDERCAAPPGGPNVVWISHAGVLRALRLLQQGQRRVHGAADWPQGGLDYGAWCAL